MKLARLNSDKVRQQQLERRRELRQSATDAESALWQQLRDRQVAGVKFRRQYQVGRYVIDFFCPAMSLAVEADGGQHFTEEGLAKDRERTSFLERLGIRVLRFTDREILLEMDDVLARIMEALGVEA